MLSTGDSAKRQIGPIMERDRGAACHGQASSRQILARGTVLAGLAFIGAAIGHPGHRCGWHHDHIRARRRGLSSGPARQAADHSEQQNNEED